jgi:hypothetical protein
VRVLSRVSGRLLDFVADVPFFASPKGVPHRGKTELAFAKQLDTLYVKR